MSDSPHSPWSSKSLKLPSNLRAGASVVVVPNAVDLSGRETTNEERSVSLPMGAAPHSNSKRGNSTGSRNSAVYQPLRLRTGGSDDRSLNRDGIFAIREFLSAIFRSARTPRADIAGALSVSSVPHRPFYLSRPFRLPGSLISIGFHRAFAVRQNFLREFAKPRHSKLPSASSRGLVAVADGHSNTERKQGNVRFSHGEIQHEQR